ncbi:hypothetical protein, partial [Escherichia coli]|uniref:hypothetical protein n=1 Tax=Escherichia coli TaxID=562 RepID=UPI00197AA005
MKCEGDQSTSENCGRKVFRKRKIEDWYNKLKKGQPELSLFCMRLKLVSTTHITAFFDMDTNFFAR